MDSRSSHRCSIEVHTFHNYHLRSLSVVDDVVLVLLHHIVLHRSIHSEVPRGPIPGGPTPPPIAIAHILHRLVEVPHVRNVEVVLVHDFGVVHKVEEVHRPPC